VATGSFAYEFGIGGDPTRAGIAVSWALPEGMSTSVDPTSALEFAAFRLVIDHRGTVGDVACAGCTVPACIALTGICLHRSAGLGNELLVSPLVSDFALWQGGTFSPCPGALPFPSLPGCEVTPTINRTWGQVKTLYR
jgi:hypothetical protein